MSAPHLPSADPPLLALRRFRVFAVIAGTVGVLLSILGGMLGLAQLLRSYLVAFAFWLAVALGSLAVSLVGQLAPGGWSIVLRRPLEAASRTVAPLFVLFLPILLGVKVLYPWARPGAMAEDPHLAAKAAYLNVPFWVARALLYFAIWSALAWGLSRMSARQDTSGDPEYARKIRKVSAVGLLLYCLTMTFAAVDWTMSLSPEWFSTIYGIYVIGGQGVAAMAFAILVILVLGRAAPDLPIRAHHVHDAGKMLLAFVMLWAYFALSQLLVTWAGNLPEEIPYYVTRLGDGYQAVSIALLVFHFAVPFLLLLSRDLKRDARRLSAVAALLLAMRWVDLYWLVAPSTGEAIARFSWLDPVAFLTIGGVWLALFVTELGRRSLLPLGEPLLAEALEHHE